MARVKAPARKAKPKLPRAPLPRQTGGRHEDKTRRPIRKRKYRPGPTDE